MLTLEEALEKEGKCVFPVKGVSMMPMLEQGRDTVVIAPVRGKLKKYELPLYKKGDAYYLHRIIGVKKKYYVICGDNCILKEKIPFENVVGVAVGFYKNGKYVSCDNEAYVDYAKKKARGRFFRSIKRNFLYGVERFFGKKQ
jgi:hypothetical protein